MSNITRFVDRRRLGLVLWSAAAFLAAAAPAALSAPANPVAGRYAILRAEDKDTGCMLTLEARGGRGGYKAQLAPACRDNGVVVFDPIGWTVDRGRLVLTARKGHKAHFDRGQDGVWRRDASEGKALGLRPL
jgi:hypothetical protein